MLCCLILEALIPSSDDTIDNDDDDHEHVENAEKNNAENKKSIQYSPESTVLEIQPLRIRKVSGG